MTNREQILNAIKYIGAAVLSIGIVMFLCGVFASGYSLLTPIGIGTIMGAVFIFLIGVFFVMTEEMLDKSKKSVR